jgi:hypothetical protein
MYVGEDNGIREMTIERLLPVRRECQDQRTWNVSVGHLDS